MRILRAFLASKARLTLLSGFTYILFGFSSALSILMDGTARNGFPNTAVAFMMSIILGLGMITLGSPKPEVILKKGDEAGYKVTHALETKVRDFYSTFSKLEVVGMVTFSMFFLFLIYNLEMVAVLRNFKIGRFDFLVLLLLSYPFIDCVIIPGMIVALLCRRDPEVRSLLFRIRDAQFQAGEN